MMLNEDLVKALHQHLGELPVYIDAGTNGILPLKSVDFDCLDPQEGFVVILEPDFEEA